MINKNIEWVILIAGIAVIFLIILYGTTDSYYKSIYANKIVDSVPAGEITQNFFLEQSIYIHSGVEHTDEINLFLLLATYDRYNDSNISISLTQDCVTDEVIFGTKFFEDNSYIRIDFNSNGFHEGPAVLCIKGLDGYPGNAATAWLTKDTSHGHALINGKETNRSLVMKYGINIDYCPHFTIGGGKFIFIIWCLTYVMVIIGFFCYYQSKE